MKVVYYIKRLSLQGNLARTKVKRDNTINLYYEFFVNFSKNRGALPFSKKILKNFTNDFCFR